MVYVDNFNAKFRNMIMCHLIADTRAELLEMVDLIGVQRKWIQNYGSFREHFDISLTKKKLALKNGAVEISSKELATKLNKRNMDDYLADPSGIIKVYLTDFSQIDQFIFNDKGEVTELKPKDPDSGIQWISDTSVERALQKWLNNYEKGTDSPEAGEP